MIPSTMARSVSSSPSSASFQSGWHFVPLGGSEQFGVNLNLYACDGKWIAVDCGIGFADQRFPNVDILLPDPSFLEDRRDDLVGLVVTHAHEDHLGAVPYLWPRLRCPVYCTRFTAAVLRAKLDDFPSCKSMKIIEVEAGGSLVLPPFSLKFLNVAHSIPEAASLAITTRYGTVVHSGDWKIDPAPVIGKPTDEAAFRTVGEAGVLAYIGDSTNCLVPGRGKSETEIEKGLATLFQEIKGRVAVTIFASNIGRIRSIALAARKTGRRVCLIGRSLHRMVASARACGYLGDVPEFLDGEDAALLSPSRLAYILTGSQGEATAALPRIARGDHPALELESGDTVVFSSRAIPGNEKEINAVKNDLSAAGVVVIDPDTTPHRIHASGHPCRDDVAEMIGWLSPRLVVPVHGERLMLDAQAALAESCGVPQTIVPVNGSVIRLAPGTPETVDHIKTGLLAVEPQRIVRSDHPGLIERRKLQFTGAAHVSVVLSREGGLLADPAVTLIGLIDSDDSGELDILTDIREEIADTLDDMREEGVKDRARMEEDIRVAVRRFLSHIFGFKPKVSVHLTVVT